MFLRVSVEMEKGEGPLAEIVKSALLYLFVGVSYSNAHSSPFPRLPPLCEDLSGLAATFAVLFVARRILYPAPGSESVCQSLWGLVWLSRSTPNVLSTNTKHSTSLHPSYSLSLPSKPRRLIPYLLSLDSTVVWVTCLDGVDGKGISANGIE